LQSPLTPLDHFSGNLRCLLGIHIENDHGIAVDTIHDPPIVFGVAHAQSAERRNAVRHPAAARPAAFQWFGLAVAGAATFPLLVCPLRRMAASSLRRAAKPAVCREVYAELS